MNKQQIIDAAMQLAAGMGQDPLASPVVDADMTAEILLPLAFRHAYKQLLMSGEMRLQDVLREHFIELNTTTDEGTLPTGVLTEHLDHSFLPDFPYSAYLQYFSDYNRSRFNALLSYYTVNAGILYSDGDPVISSKTLASVSLIQNDDLVTTTSTNLALTDEGKRLRVVVSGVTQIDAIIDDFLTTSTVNLRGRATANLVANALNIGTIYRTDNDQIVRSLTVVNTTINDETVTCAGAAFTDADIGRRLRVVDGATQVIDAYIASRNSATSVEMSARALATTAIGTADVLYTPLVLHAPSIPVIPASVATDITMPQAALDAVIMTLALALRGDLKLMQ
jgi:hypothetical protein